MRLRRVSLSLAGLRIFHLTRVVFVEFRLGCVAAQLVVMVYAAVQALEFLLLFVFFWRVILLLKVALLFLSSFRCAAGATSANQEHVSEPIPTRAFLFLEFTLPLAGFR